MKKIIWISDLPKLFSVSHPFGFSSKREGAEIVVSIPATFEEEPSDDERFLKVKIKACHTGENLNGSNIIRKAMERGIDSFRNCPILASVIVSEDGEYDFSGHDMELIDDPFKEGEYRMFYIEHPVGVIPSDANIVLESEETDGKSFLYSDGLIYCEHGNYAADILKKREEVACSVEISVKDAEFDSSGILNITDFVFVGVTLLGKNVEEGMKGSRVVVGKEASNNSKGFVAVNSLDNNTSEDSQLENEKGGIDKLFEKLLEKYNKTEEDITFDYSDMTDEELEKAFKDAFDPEDGEEGKDPTEEGEVPADDAETPEEGSADEDPEDEDPEDEDAEDYRCGNGENKEKKKYTVNGADCETYEISREISSEDIKCALYSLIDSAYEGCFYIEETFETHFIMSDFNSNEVFGQNYTVDGDSVSLDGDRYPMYKEYLTEEEMNALNEMKNNYEATVEKLKGYEEDEEKSKKTALAENDSYSKLAGYEEYDKLVENMDEYSYEEFEKELKIVLADYVQENGIFSARSTKKPFLGIESRKNNAPAKNSFMESLLNKNNQN